MKDKICTNSKEWRIATMEAEIANVENIMLCDSTLSENDREYFTKYKKQLEEDLLEELLLIPWEDE